MLRCFGTNLFGPSRVVVLLSGLFAWCGSLIENSEKRIGITLWQAQYFFHAIGMMAVHRGLISPVSCGLSYLFSLACGILHYFYHQEPESCNTTGAALVKAFVGKDKENRSIIETVLFKRISRGGGKFTYTEAFTGMLSSFQLGYMLQNLLSFLMGLKGGISSSIKSVKSTHSSALKLGLFLALLNSARGIRILIREVFFKNEKTIPGFLDFGIGCLVGLSMRGTFESSVISLWTLALALHSVLLKYQSTIWNLVNGGKDDESRKKQFWNKAGVVVYSIMTTISLYALQYEPDATMESGKAILSAMAGGQEPTHYANVSHILRKCE
eukprot:TRINITY_DN2708_c0_g1_i1.p1 TRINITY_DN2708_c0_g1~~TRINITY_DN2708_c0_g1_i1.p1  ORF type:complete len:326 (+),score=47.98 TRINITY_DN2708_c0_g1_i1:435-1412(+)